MIRQRSCLVTQGREQGRLQGYRELPAHREPGYFLPTPFPKQRHSSEMSLGCSLVPFLSRATGWLWGSPARERKPAGRELGGQAPAQGLLPRASEGQWDGGAKPRDEFCLITCMLKHLEVQMFAIFFKMR